MMQDSAALHVEDYAYAKFLARGIVDRAIEGPYLDAMLDIDNRLRALRHFRPIEPLTEQERAEGTLHRIRLHVRRHP